MEVLLRAQESKVQEISSDITNLISDVPIRT